MRVGDIVETQSVQIVSGEHGPKNVPTMKFGFKPPAGERFEFLYLGRRVQGERFDALAVIEQLGFQRKDDAAMFACWFDIMRQRGAAAADLEMFENMKWIAPGYQP